MSNPHDSSSGLAYPELLSLAVHELRTPISVAGGYLRMLQRDQESGFTNRQRKMIAEADKACARIVSLIGELSDLANLDAGVLPLNEDSFDLFQLLQEIASNLHEAGDAEVRLLVRGDATGAPLTADRNRVRAAFSALYHAVLREETAGATVVIDRGLVRDGGAHAAVTVIAPDGSVQHAFGAGRRAFDEKRGGFGLALPLARRVITRYGGHIWSLQLDGETSEAPNRTAIVVTLPIAVDRRL